VRVVNAVLPEGPITIERYDPSKGQKVSAATRATISTQMLWRVANGIEQGVPVNFDRLLGASYNTRSALEALLAHTPEFYWCLPGRIEILNSSSEIKRGHKHLMWLPYQPHELGKLKQNKSDLVISELPSNSVVYEALSMGAQSATKMDLDVARRHLQVQVALILIGQQLGYRTWVARNDKGFKYGDRKIGELDGVVVRLNDEKLLMAYSEAVQAALQIDCIWFRNSHFMPAVIEIEHSTGVTSGLTRMKNLQSHAPHILTRWVIAAPDEDREKVLREANKPDFQSLNVQFFPYSAVDELFGLVQRRKLTKASINDEFLNCFFEPCLTNHTPSRGSMTALH
jgi:type II restriction enzyme